MKQPIRRQTISASEVGDFVFCAKSWKLKRAGEKPESESLQKGIDFHQSHASKVRQSTILGQASRSVFFLVVFLFLLYIVYWFLTAQGRP